MFHRIVFGSVLRLAVDTRDSQRISVSPQKGALHAVELPRETSDVVVENLFIRTKARWMSRLTCGCYSYITNYIVMDNAREECRGRCSKKGEKGLGTYSSA